MNDDTHDIDRLLQANTEEQLARLDWDRFGDDVSKRLATIGFRPRPRARYLGPLAVAAGLLLTTGVLVAVIVRLREPEPVPSSSPGRATVSIQESGEGTGSATVAPAADRAVRCEVTLLDSGAPSTDRHTRGSWCVIARRAPCADDPGRTGSRANIVHLF